MSDFKEIAIIGATASGKTSLAIEMAHKHNAIIFSIDSLAVYKEMDIVSAKPSKEEQDGILHLGIDVLEVPEHFSASHVIDLYKNSKEQALQMGKNLIIVGGSSFYLKTLLTGLSQQPDYSKETIHHTKNMMQDLASVYALLEGIDNKSVEKISSNDSYRLEKLLLIYNQTGLAPSEYFASHQPEAIIKNLKVFELSSDKDVLRERIALRTQLMIQNGLIDEIAYLEKKFARFASSMKAIGVIEVLSYLDNEITKQEMADLITTHTSQLAKRQNTFNKTQFDEVVSDKKDILKEKISYFFDQKSTT